ncbi:CHASE3 domain-containing protein [Cytophagaceae bacterium DM2B3-1]|uniref:histidine kinase n=1 Tax=Xanthocytophaga flava TaxID=3048013 RepID=A0ABT7CYL5_9BACT|nr:ATP-binding protein [Xanthocytophaga flavus]MDJ1498870.1 CHASE3 domain-containing protein [Xanthocytophaga flavus]
MRRNAVYNTIAFILSVTILINISILAYNRIQNLVNSSESVEHTYQTLLYVEEMFTNLRSAVNSQRGYLLSGDSLHLINYHQYKKDTYSKLHQTDSITSDNPIQRHNLDTLRHLLDQRFANLDSLVAVYQDAYTPTNTVFRGDISYDRKTTEQLLAKLRSIRTHEQKLKEERTLIKNASEAAAPVFLLILAIITLCLLIFSFLILNKELRKRLATQIELELKVEALNRSNQELEQFAYVASHDLQEPLRKIMTFGSMLKTKQKDKLDQEGNRTLDTIMDLSRRMKQLIEDLLSFSRIVNQNQTFVSTDLNILLKQVLDDLSEPIQQQQAQISIGKLPTLRVQPVQIQQLFQNLLLNSLKYAKPGVPPIIQISSQISTNQELNISENMISRSFYKIQIADNGIGFEQEYAEKIFTIFQRLHTQEEYKGTGVGLAVCKRVVTNHGGYIQAIGTPAQGAIFSVYLPA